MNEPSPFQMMEFAKHAHRNISRKYTNEPYHSHLAEVAGIVSTVVFDIAVPEIGITPNHIMCVAWGHDLYEDTDTEIGEVVRLFGDLVSGGISVLSEHTEVGNRAQRKRAVADRLCAAPGWLQSIKCANLISNAPSIFKYDPRFAPLFCLEAIDLLRVMSMAHPSLKAVARETLRKSSAEHGVVIPEYRYGFQSAA